MNEPYIKDETRPRLKELARTLALRPHIHHQELKDFYNGQHAHTHTHKHNKE